MKTARRTGAVEVAEKEVNMSVIELLRKAQFVVDASGNRKAVLLDYAAWEELLTLLEDWEDSDEIRRLREAGEQTISWEEAKAELRTEGVDV